MDWKTLVGRVLAQTPHIVDKVETTHAAASNADKRSAALDWLVFAAEVASACAPEATGLIQAVATVGGAVIDASVAMGKAAGGLKAPQPQAPAAQ